MLVLAPVAELLAWGKGAAAILPVSLLDLVPATLLLGAFLDCVYFMHYFGEWLLLDWLRIFEGFVEGRELALGWGGLAGVLD